MNHNFPPAFLANLTAKRLELLKEMGPKLRRVVGLYNPANAAVPHGCEVLLQHPQEFARSREREPDCIGLGIQCGDLVIYRPHDLDDALL